MSDISQIRGFDWEEIAALEGSRNKALLKSYLELYEDEDGFLDEYVDERKVLKLFFMLNARKAEFDNESSEHYSVMQTLITESKGFIYTSYEWGFSSAWEHLLNLDKKLTGRPQQLIHYFIAGRSMFGDSAGSGTNSMPYTLLTIEEVKELVMHMSENKQAYWDSDGFHEHFHVGLTELATKNKALYFTWC